MNFPKSARVLTRREYLQFFTQSAVKRLGSSIIFRIPNEKGEPRVGITVKSRTNSVLRNKIKRQIREVYRKGKQKVYDDLGDKKILVMLVYTAKTKMEFKELEAKTGKKVVTAINAKMTLDQKKRLE